MMDSCAKMWKLSTHQWQLFRRLQRKHKVSASFLNSNIADIEVFILHEFLPRIIIKCYAVRRNNRIILLYNRLRRVLFDHKYQHHFRRRKENVRNWSHQIVSYYRRTFGVKEYFEDKILDVAATDIQLSSEEISKQLKEQLQLLKSDNRIQSLVNFEHMSTVNALDTDTTDFTAAEENLPSLPNSSQEENANNIDDNSLVAEFPKDGASIYINSSCTTADNRIASPDIFLQMHNKILNEQYQLNNQWQKHLEMTPEKQIVTDENALSADSYLLKNKYISPDEKTEDSVNVLEENKSNITFLDMLINKVGISEQAIKRPLSDRITNIIDKVESMESGDEFLGFEEADRIPGMLMTPVIPKTNGHPEQNSIFVSEKLNEYMRINSLETDYKIDSKLLCQPYKQVIREGLVTPKCELPPLDMPVVPNSLLKLRTVAERKQYLQKCCRSPRLSIINNEAAIYRELQRKQRLMKAKSNGQVVAQSLNSSMSFSRNGWQAASFVNTEFNKYYYQMLVIDKTHQIHLRGVQGNNAEFYKRPYESRVASAKLEDCCSDNCLDREILKRLKAIRPSNSKKKLNKNPLAGYLKPCPLLYKPFQKPIDDETAALVLAGGSMAIVQMPSIELEVFPRYGKPLHELAKRYLQFILPHNNITREWAEFSVSTLQLTAAMSSCNDTELIDTSQCKSFSFPIPYFNDRCQMLVRRVVDRSEKLDQLFEIKQENNEIADEQCNTSTLKDLHFRSHLNEADEIQMVCADILSDMINTVAISCSENSFIKSDPDGVYNDNDSVDEIDVKANQHSNAIAPCISQSTTKKQNRLLLELKRLNATIIDAAVKKHDDGDTKSCRKDYCALGCICASLHGAHPLRSHCGKAKCVLECNCKSNHQTRVVRLETSDHAFTSEDAFLLRRKATARLARMEKEFTSTVVLTGNETLLINETNSDKKRRCSKAPKRYQSFAAGASSKSDAASSFKKPVYVDYSVLEKLKHLRVNLVRLEDTGNMVPWCMVHELYKCYCKGHDVEGKPCIIGKEEGTSVSKQKTENDIDLMDNVTRTESNYKLRRCEKRKLSPSHTKLERMEETDEVTDECTIKPTKQIKVHSKTSNDSLKTINCATNSLDSKQKSYNKKKRRNSSLDNSDSPKSKHTRIEEDIRKTYYSLDADCCRRQIPIPRRMFFRCNRRRRAEVLAYIREHETESTRLLLNEHILRSIYYNNGANDIGLNGLTTKIYRSIPEEDEKKTELLLKQLFNTTKAALPTKLEHNSKQYDNIINLMNDDEDNGNNFTNASKHLTNEHISHSQNTEIDANANANANGMPMIKLKTLASLTGADVNQWTEVGRKVGEQNDGLPRIANTFSLKLKPIAELQNAFDADVQRRHESAKQILEAEQTMLALAKEINMSSENFQTLYNDVILTMNNMVCKKMCDISEAFKRESITIPHPRDGILTIMRWANFNTAYNQNCLFMWQVKMKEQRSFLVVTLDNIMPLIAGAIGVANITALKTEKLPFMARMLCKGYQHPNSHNLAVIMQGRRTHWLVKGFIRGEAKYVCFKPNLQTKPVLTKKINALCCLLLRKRIREEKLKLLNRRTSMQRMETALPTSTSYKIENPNSFQIVDDLQQAQRNASTIDLFAENTQNSWQRNDNTHFIPAMCKKEQDTEEVERTNELKDAEETEETDNAASDMIRSDEIFENTNSLNETEKNDGTILESIPTSIHLRGSVKFGIPQKWKRNNLVKMRSNIEIRKVTEDDIDDLRMPMVLHSDHKWLVLDLHKDFSHIFVLNFRELLSSDRIQKVMSFARQKQKTIKMQFFKNAPFDVYVTPVSKHKIYVGPIPISGQQPVLILLQSVDGQMMMRELYQRKHKVQNVNGNRTTAFWLLSINGQMHLEIDANDPLITQSKSALNIANDSRLTIAKYGTANSDKGENNNDDCVVVSDDEDISPSLYSESTPNPNEVKHATITGVNSNNNSDLQTNVQSKDENGGIDAQPLFHLAPMPVTLSPKTIHQLSAINTTIKPLSTTIPAAGLENNDDEQSNSRINVLPLINLPENTFLTAATSTASTGNMIPLGSQIAPIDMNMMNPTSGLIIVSSSAVSVPSINYYNYDNVATTSFPDNDLQPQEVNKTPATDAADDSKLMTHPKAAATTTKSTKILNPTFNNKNSVLKSILKPLIMEKSNNAEKTSSAVTNCVNSKTAIQKLHPSSASRDSSCIQANAVTSTVRKAMPQRRHTMLSVSNPNVFQVPTIASVTTLASKQQQHQHQQQQQQTKTNYKFLSQSKILFNDSNNRKQIYCTNDDLSNNELAAAPKLPIRKKIKLIPKNASNTEYTISTTGSSSILEGMDRNIKFNSNLLVKEKSTVTTKTTPPAKCSIPITPTSSNIAGKNEASTSPSPKPCIKLPIRRTIKNQNSLLLNCSAQNQNQKQVVNNTNQPSKAAASTSLLQLKKSPDLPATKFITNSKQQQQQVFQEEPSSSDTSLSDNACSTELPSNVQYGYIISNGCSQRFIAKRLNNFYYIKLPEKGILRFDSFANVVSFLNRTISNSINDNKPKLPLKWRFIAASRGIQLQNHTKFLVRKKFLHNGGGMYAANPRSVQVATMNDNKAAIRSPNCTNETILIDD